MLGALALIWIGFDLAVRRRLPDAAQSVEPLGADGAVAVMAAGMVLVIVARHIDLSVGSILGLVGMIMGVTQAEFLPKYLGFDHPLIWVIALAVGLAVGAAIGCCRAHRRLSRRAGLHRDVGRPAGVARLRLVVTSGRTVAPMDDAFQRMGGGIEGAIGADWTWIVALIAFAAIVWRTLHARRRAPAASASPLRPIWAEVDGRRARRPRRVVASSGRQQLRPAAARRRSHRRRARPHRAAAGPVDRARPRHAGADRRRCRHRRDLPRAAHALRALRVRAWAAIRRRRSSSASTPRASPCCFSC